ncbi:hypothetical protein BDR22DRAFT_817551 [Usnea florida]
MDSPDTRPLTFTRVIPDHYDTDIKSPSPSLDVDKRPFPFMFLPVELRIKVYEIYLTDRSTRPTPARENHHPETQYAGKMRHSMVLRCHVCSQEACVGTMITSRTSESKFIHDIQIVLLTWYTFGDTFRPYVRILKKLPYAEWSFNGLPLETFECLDGMQMQYAAWYACDLPGAPYTGGWEKGREPWDILHILNLFRLLKNVKEAQVHLPLSVAQDVRLQEEGKYTEEVMMQTTSLDDKRQRSVIDTIEKAIADREEFFEFFTGSCAQERLDSLCGEGCFILKHHLDIFEKVWPHRVCADDYQRPSHYIGIEGMEEKTPDASPSIFVYASTMHRCLAASGVGQKRKEYVAVFTMGDYHRCHKSL